MYPKYYPSPFILIILFCLLLASCDRNSQTGQEVDRVTGQLSNELKEQTSKLGNMIPSRQDIQKSSEDQIQKTFAIEYRVVDVSSELPAEQLQRTMESLGQERWDCFATIPRSESLRLLCRRRPLSALRALIGAGALIF